jgi:hypothetical protein
MPPATHVPVKRHHRAAAMMTLLPNTRQTSEVWQAFVERGDGSDPRIKDLVRVAQHGADAEAGLLLPPEEQAKPAPSPATPAVGLNTGTFMPEKK